MIRLFRVASDVSRALMTLADELREVGLVEQAVRCDRMSRQLSEAVMVSMKDTQKIDVDKLDLKLDEPDD